MALNDNIAKELKRYQYAELAASSLQGEDPVSAGISLEKLAGDMGLKKTSDEYGFIEGSLASEDGIKAATSIYIKKYQSALEKATVGDLWAVYGGNFSENEQEIYGSKINQYSGMKLKDMQSKLKSNKEKLKKYLDGGSHDPRIFKIRAEIKDYEEILGLIESAKQLNYVILSEPVQKDVTKKRKKAINDNMRNIIGLSTGNSHRMAA